MDLSIIIVNWNTKELIEDCIHSINMGPKIHSYEIIVVDNGSKDQSVEMIKKKFPEVILIENNTNIGYSKANNLGIKRSRGDYICLLNSDTLILNSALEKIVSHLKNDSKVGSATCMLLNPDGSTQFGSALGEPNLTYFLSVETGLYKFFPKSQIWGRPLLSYKDHRYPHEIEVCPSAIIIIKKQVFKDVGLLDENIFFGVIDWDFSLRVRKKGWKQYFYPDAYVLHYGGKSKAPISERLLVEDINARYYYFLKHYGESRTNILKLIIVMASFVKIIYFTIMLVTRFSKIPKNSIKDRINSYITKTKVSLSMIQFKIY